MNLHSFLRMTGTLACATLGLAACGGDDTTDATTTSSSTSSTMDSASASSGQGGQGGASASSGQGGAGGDTSSSSSSASSASASSSSASASSSTGGGDPMVNGCTLATAKDMTGQKSVTITDVSPWTFNHQACIVVTGGTQVVWNGDFAAHPLSGGEVGTADIASPISMAMTNNGTATAFLPVDAGKAYPYFCSKHSNMKGVVYVK